MDPRDPYAYAYGELTEEQIRVQPTYPSIQPPSTGELVPASHPTAGIGANELAVEPSAEEQQVSWQTTKEQPAEKQSAAEIATDTNNPAVEDADKTIESAARNG